MKCILVTAEFMDQSTLTDTTPSLNDHKRMFNLLELILENGHLLVPADELHCHEMHHICMIWITKL